ncbi:MAG: hypothetical protein MIO90_04695 [Methanomassiliicoccales archaeon]|nr:hypothetical protein [Methanomassiliicoccales archaeon]
MLLLVASLLICAVPMVQADDGTTPLHAQLDGPLIVTTGSRNQYVLTMLGGPAEIGVGNYSYKATMVGEVIGDAMFLPSSGGPKTSGRFYLNLTAPTVPQVLTIVINCTSSNTLTTVKTSIELSVEVVEPVTFSANIINTGNVSATAVPLALQIYENGIWVEFYNTTLDLAAGESYAFQYNLTALGLEYGEHKVRMLLDPDNSIVTFEGGASVYETTIYYHMPGYGGLNTLLWILVVALAAVTFLIWRRPTPKGKKKKKR